MKSLIIPDIHNKIDKVDKILNLLDADNQFKEIIFLGDYFDSFHDTPYDALMTARWLKNSIEKSNRIHLIGNHDVPYFSSSFIYPCPGFTMEKYLVINEENIDPSKLRPAYFSQGFVFSHAGFSPKYVLDISAEEAIELAEREYEKVLDQRISFLFEAGARLQRGYTGGITWLDWNMEFEPTNFNQIVGHTSGKEIRKKGSSFCVDCSLRYVVVVDEEGLTIIDADYFLEVESEKKVY